MPNIEHPARTATRSDPATPIGMGATLFAAVELSLSSWVAVASAPGTDKTSKHGLPACDGPGLVALLRRLRERAERRCGRPVAVVVMQEAGRDGFWVHRLLEAHGIRSLVVDPSSIAVNRRSRRAKTDRIDAETMLRTLMAWSPSCGGCGSAPSGAAAGRSRWSSRRRPAVMGSGFTACWKRTGHAALLSIHPPLR